MTYFENIESITPASNPSTWDVREVNPNTSFLMEDAKGKRMTDYDSSMGVM